MAKDDPIRKYASPPPAGTKGKTHQVPYHTHKEGLPRLSLSTGGDDYVLDVADQDVLTDGGTVRAARIRHYVTTASDAVDEGAVEGLYVMQQLHPVGETGPAGGFEGGAIHGELVVTTDRDLDLADPVMAGVYGEVTWPGSAASANGYCGVGARVNITGGNDDYLNLAAMRIASPVATAATAQITHGLYIDDQYVEDDLVCYAIYAKSGSCVFNQSGEATSDFTIQSDTKYLFVLDAGAETVRIGDRDTNYAQWASDGELSLHGTAQVTRSLPLPLTIGGGTADIESFMRGPSINLDANGETWYSAFEVPRDWNGTSDLTLVYMVANEITEDDGDEVEILAYLKSYADGETMSLMFYQTVVCTLVLTGGDEAINKINRVSGTVDYDSLTAPIAAGDTVTIESHIVLGLPGACTGPLHVVAQWVEYTANKLGTAT